MARNARRQTVDNFDITATIGDLFPIHSAENPPAWPMYSYSRPSGILWNAIGRELCRKGWSDKQIKEWLQSKSTRWALDGELGDAIDKLGRDYAASIT